jgi:ferredoxin
VRVRIDADRCEGHAVCASLVPDVFEIPEEGAGAHVATEVVNPALEGAVRRAVSGCPERAIVVDED